MKGTVELRPMKEAETYCSHLLLTMEQTLMTGNSGGNCPRYLNNIISVFAEQVKFNYAKVNVYVIWLHHNTDRDKEPEWGCCKAQVDTEF